MQLSHDQEHALEQAAKWLSGVAAPTYEKRYDKDTGDVYTYTVGTSHGYPVFSVGGYAGTGKTTILRHLADNHPSAALVTPTHKAAQVLRAKLPVAHGARVQTFHSLIYSPDPQYTCGKRGERMDPPQPVSCACDNRNTCTCTPFFSPCARHAKQAPDGRYCDPYEELKFSKRQFLAGSVSLIVVDEASMLDEAAVNDLRSYGVPVLLCGDSGQLPPVKSTMNSWIQNPTVSLTVNHRQEDATGIPGAAVLARESGTISLGVHGSSCHVIAASSDAAEQLLERFRPDARNSTLLVSYNRTRAGLNKFFHEKISVGAKSHTIVPGERIISLGRQDDAQELDEEGQVVHETLIRSGTFATVTQVISAGPKVTMLTATLDWDWLGRENVPFLLEVATEQFGRPDQLSYKTRPPRAALWDYAYALTVHKAQGSEFSRVVILQETKGDKRSLYTAVTRARDALVVLV